MGALHCVDAPLSGWTRTREASVVELHSDAIDCLLLIAIRPHLQLGLPDPARPVLAPLPHSRGNRVVETPLDPLSLQHGALRVRNEEDVVVRHREVEEAEAWVAPLVFGGLDDAVDRRFVVPAREELHRVACVDDLVADVGLIQLEGV